MKAPLATPADESVPSVASPSAPEISALPRQPTLAEVYRAHRGDVARWVARLGGPRVEVDDLVQEIFVVVGRRLPDFRGDAKLTTWLFRVTDRVVRNHRRWLAVRRIMTRLTFRHEEQLSASGEDALATLEQRGRTERAFALLDTLPENQRRALVLAELEEMPAEEIAELLGTKVETVRVWLHRGRKTFEARLTAADLADEGEGA